MPSIGIILPPKWLSFNFAPILKPTNTQTLERHNKLIFLYAKLTTSLDWAQFVKRLFNAQQTSFGERVCPIYRLVCL